MQTLYTRNYSGEKFSLEAEGEAASGLSRDLLRWLHLGQIKTHGMENKAEQKKMTPQD